jgi:hypothetical protein
MDDRSMQFALFLGIAAALLVLVVIGVEVIRRAIALRRQRRPSEPVLAHRVGEEHQHRAGE